MAQFRALRVAHFGGLEIGGRHPGSRGGSGATNAFIPLEFPWIPWEISRRFEFFGIARPREAI